jgi:hypothetical protein
VLDAVHDGGTFAAYRRAFQAIEPRRRTLPRAGRLVLGPSA